MEDDMISIKKANKSLVYPSNQLPSSINAKCIVWHHVGDNEQFTVYLWREAEVGLQVFEQIWNENTADYDARQVPTDSVSISLYL
jgi:hypothetical protein